ncbi:MAG: hypothetical protein H8E57_05635 [Candidatus Cloacimonetes bacterium]|nr:hypothetical protein [Candidatus Cloacimonadota bacterium]
MKRNKMFFLFTLGLLICFSSSLSALLTISSLYTVYSSHTINDDVLITSNGAITSYGGHHTLTINGNVTNNGNIRNHEYDYYLYLEVSSDVINNGSWRCANTYLTGTSSQGISCGSANNFSGWNFFNTNADSIIVQSNLNFLSYHVDFQDNGHLDLSGGWNLNLSGGNICNADIIGEPVSGSGLNMTNYAYAASCSLENMISTGVTLIADSGCSITGFFINNGTLKSTGSNQTLTINGNIINNGS